MGAGKRSEGVTAKQELFVREYLVSRNATRAAEAAGYSARTAGAQGSRLLTNVNVAARIHDLERKREWRLDRSGDQVIRLLWELAERDLARAHGENGDLLPLKEIPPDVRRLISSLETEVREIGAETAGNADRKIRSKLLKLRTDDRLAALRLLGQHYGLFRVKVELSGKVKLEDILAASQEAGDPEAAPEAQGA